MPVLRASEVREYVFCARAWWLRRVIGLEPDKRQRTYMEHGTLLHKRHGLIVKLSSFFLLVSIMLLILAALATFAL